VYQFFLQEDVPDPDEEYKNSRRYYDDLIDKVYYNYKFKKNVDDYKFFQYLNITPKVRRAKTPMSKTSCPLNPRSVKE